MIDIGATARRLRESFGLSQSEAAKQLGITNVHLCNIERGRSSPSAELLERYRTLWEVDIYVLAWCEGGHVDGLPDAVRKAAQMLAVAWEARISGVVSRRNLGEKTECSTFVGLNTSCDVLRSHRNS